MSSIEIPELKSHTTFVSATIEFDLFKRYSSYSKLIRIVAYCLRFRLRGRQSGPLIADAIREVEYRILKMVQATQFSDIIKILKGKHRANPGRIANLSPFIDENGLIRVGGRIQKSNLPISQKHPILLPSRHQLTDKIIREAHEKRFHAGIKTTVYCLRQRFWILDACNQTRKIIRNCIRCCRYAANAIKYKMGNLPAPRVREAIPFAHTGIDFAGPFYIKEKKYRNQKRIKVYICIFICMSIKAVHIELVSDLSFDAFTSALRRFVARRGIPEHIYSDNGTNFIGANNQLRELYALYNSVEHKNVVIKIANEYRITWHFIPPAAPHSGGLW